MKQSFPSYVQIFRFYKIQKSFIYAFYKSYSKKMS